VNTPAGIARPLTGRCVLVTRPRAQADELIAQLEAHGARVVVSPTIRIAAPVDPAPLFNAAAHLSEFDWVVFTSANAVDALLDAVQRSDEESRAHPPVNQAMLPKVAAVGSRTAERLRSRGIAVTVVPDEFTAEGLLNALTTEAGITGARVLVPRSEIGRMVLADGLRAAGALVTEVIAYRTVPESADSDTASVRELLARGELDAVTFTSASAVGNFVQMLGPESVRLLCHTVVAVIGPVTAQAAREIGVDVQVQPASYTAAGMVAALVDFFAQPEG
jgi:uroporphyrinogen III methyltransferase/synthase